MICAGILATSEYILEEVNKYEVLQIAALFNVPGL